MASAGIAPNYLKDYFTASPGRPEAVLPAITGLGSMHGTILSHLSEVTVHEACAYIWECFPLFKGTLREGWTSYDVPLGDPGAVVTPASVVQLATDTNLTG